MGCWIPSIVNGEDCIISLHKRSSTHKLTYLSMLVYFMLFEMVMNMVNALKIKILNMNMPKASFLLCVMGNLQVNCLSSPCRLKHYLGHPLNGYKVKYWNEIHSLKETQTVEEESSPNVVRENYISKIVKTD